jgi:FkbM family methyltransferase
MFSLLAYQRFPDAQFDLFEPNPTNVATLRRVVEENGLPFTVVEAAVSTSHGTAPFRAESSLGGRLLHTQQSGEYDCRVKCIDLAEVIRAKAPERLLIKIDVEGHEDVVLPAILNDLPRQTTMFFETHYGEQQFQEICDTLRSVGFNVLRTRTRGLYSDGYAERR